MNISVWNNNKSNTANTYYRIIFSIIIGLLFSLSSKLGFAQATQETDGKIYTAEVVQVDETKKTVKYFRDKEWVIIPPAVTDGKLVDGSIAPDHPLRAKNAQVKILVTYDKIIIVKTEKNDLLYSANKELWLITTLAEQWRLTKEELFKWFYSNYLINVWIGSENTNKSIDDNNKIIRGLEAYGKLALKLSSTEIELMKKLAGQKAKETMNRFSSATE